ncbi:MAG: alpha/beta fold hydrolase [Dehalococcoidia bacterium]
MSFVLDPKVQYARTSDGVNIAFCTFGEDRGALPLICLRPPHLSHMALEWELPFETRWHEFETLSQSRMVVRLDSRGSGLSDRGVEDVSLEARCRDIEAVVNRLGLTRFAIQAQLHAGSWGIAYAAAYPEKVSHLILVQTYLDGRAYWNMPARIALEPLARLDWTTYTEATLSSAFSWAPSSLPRAMAKLMRSAITQDDYLRYHAEDRTVNVTEAMRTVQCPVLVANFQLNMVTGPDVARRIASNARDGRLLLPRTFVEALSGYDDFLNENASPETAPLPMPPPDAFRIFLVAHASASPGVVELLVKQHGGLAVSTLDGRITSLFESAAAAVACAKALAHALGAAVGVHAGEPGDGQETADPALVTAALAAGMAAAGQAVVSNIIRELSAGKGFGFDAFDGRVPAVEDHEIRLFTLR